MSTVRFIGCLHFDHLGMAKHRGFETSERHDEYLIDYWNSRVHKRDLTFILGDISMESAKPYPLLNRLAGRKIVVLGNHDLHKHTRELLNYVETVAGCIDYKGFVLTHVPIHPLEIGGCRGNIHAHIHQNDLTEYFANKLYLDDKTQIPTLARYFNVDAARIDYHPQTIEQLLKSKPC